MKIYFKIKNKSLLIKIGEEDPQKGPQIPSMWWVILCPWCFSNWLSLLMCEKPRTMCRTQMGAQVKRDNNGENDNDHGEEWMEKPPIYNKVLGWSW